MLKYFIKKWCNIRKSKWIFFALVAALLAYLAMDLQRQQPGQGQEGEAVSLEEFMSRQPGPWVYHDHAGVRSELYFNPEQKCMMLEQDRDGDGVNDYYQTFQTR